MVVAAAFAVSPGIAGCASGGEPGGKTSSSPARTSTVPTGRAAPPSGAIGLSPAGVTTRVDVPAESTEEEYYQACHAAKVWMDAHPRPGESLFEPYLAMLQTTTTSTTGTWNIRWPDLTPARQAAVITAVRAAADNECD